ncbi:MAG: hypothetical protein QOK14_1363 [Frankiaceae bacterium]|nr:hypothetical protein [Frankiaceae bacterium]
MSTPDVGTAGHVPPAPEGAQPALRVVVVGSGWRFTSGISYYTWRLVTALHDHGHAPAALLMRRLLPARLYPGRERVGAATDRPRYDAAIPVFDGVDWWAVPSLFRAVRFLRRARPQVVILEWWTATVLHSYLVLSITARLLRAKVVVEFHEVLDTAELRVPLVGPYSRSMARLILRFMDAAIVHSDYDRALLQRVYQLPGVPTIVTAHGPFDYLVATESEPATGDEDTSDRPFDVLFFGTIRPYKGLEHLVAAFDALSPEEVTSYRLTVVGETWEGWTLPAELIAASPRRDRIRFVNRYVDDREAARFFASADAVVLPYLRSSASGPLHLAMSHGLPLAITDVGGLREAAQDYEGAVFVQPGDPAALTEAIRLLRTRRGMRYADPQSWSRTVGAIESLAGTLLSATVPPTGRRR